MEALRDYLHHRTYNFRKDACDPLKKIKRPIGYVLLEEISATSDEQLLGTIWSEINRKSIHFVLALLVPLGREPPDCKH